MMSVPIIPTIDYRVIPGWFDFENLYEAAIAAAPDGGMLVEIGCWMGKSAHFMCSKIRASGKKLRFVCVDTWQGSVEHQPHMAALGGSVRPHFDKFMKEHEGYYEAIQKPSLEAVHDFPDASINFLFIDGSHEYDDVKADVTAWLPKVVPGGVIAGHDFNWEGVRRAVDELLGAKNVRAVGSSWYMRIPDGKAISSGGDSAKAK